MVRNYRDELTDDALRGFVEEVDLLCLETSAGEGSAKFLLEEEVLAICNVLDAFGRFCQRKLEGDPELEGFWDDSERRDLVVGLGSAMMSLHIFGTTGSIYLRTYRQPEEDYFKGLVERIKRAVAVFPEVALSIEAGLSPEGVYEGHDTLREGARLAHFLAASLPVGGSTVKYDEQPLRSRGD